ncbi:hypothetical protein GRI89_03295 [Altererythrobacter salegens]|uniref:DUF4239 domain-containing protein n=1 Tax=Croceibacterium salegens TaxID=1737568 RepID=A0A6I4SU21_9SPHN|nr:hypothetical protein [Croceibacterium salegens]MXO58567.1 hypothetical protein [Croceibacterium salegens]
MFEQGSMSEISVTVFVGMLLAAVLGYAVRHVPALIRHGPDQQEDSQEGYVVSAVLGLLALLLGFTFSLALDRFEERRQMVLEESNAIGTAYLRAQLVPEPSRAELSQTLIDYTNNRLELSRLEGGEAGLPEHMERNDALLTELWARTVRMTDSVGSNPITALVASSINSVIDMDAARKNARMAKVPSAVYSVLLVYLLMSAGILGYTLINVWVRIAAVVLFVLFTMSLILIVDIDRPLVGHLREQQKPMEDLQAFMQTAPPARFHSPAVTN